MTKYEYDFANIELDEQQQAMIEIGVGNVAALNPIIRDILNERAKTGWEPMYPFSVPQIWFRRAKPVRRKTTKKP
jgi:hypothetical protein